jgi:hypothetical protein
LYLFKNNTTNDNSALIKFIGKQNIVFTVMPTLSCPVFWYLKMPPIKPITITTLINSVHINPVTLDQRLVLMHFPQAMGSEKNEYGAKHRTFDK